MAGVGKEMPTILADGQDGSMWMLHDELLAVRIKSMLDVAFCRRSRTNPIFQEMDGLHIRVGNITDYFNPGIGIEFYTILGIPKLGFELLKFWATALFLAENSQ